MKIDATASKAAGWQIEQAVVAEKGGVEHVQKEERSGTLMESAGGNTR